MSLPVSSVAPATASRFRFEGYVEIAFLMALAGSWVGLLGRWHWALDLFSHFRWQYLLVGLVALVWALWRRQSTLLLGVCVATLLLNGSLLYMQRGRPEFAETKGARLRLVCLNVLTSNPAKKEVLEYLRTTPAEVVLLIEVNAEWAEAMEPLKQIYPHQLMEAQEGNFGMALYSKLPLTEARFFQVNDEAMPSVQAQLTHEGQEMMLLGVHPLPPIGGRLAARRDSEMQAMAEYVKAIKLPVLLMGDLNATPWSQGMRLIRQDTGLDFRCGDGAWRPTWKVGTVFSVPIDHALCTAPLVVARRQIGPDVGSDHRPQLLEVGWAK